MKVATINEAATVGVIALLTCGLLFSTIAYFFIRSRLIQKTAEAEKNREHDEAVALAAEIEKNLTAQPEVQSDGVLPESSTLLGVIKLEAYAQKVKPKFIVGINRGGWLLSTYLAHRLEIKRSRILRYDSDKGRILETGAESKVVAGDTILLVDDISRSGRSMRQGLAYIREHFPNSKTKTSVLVVCKDNYEGELKG